MKFVNYLNSNKKKTKIINIKNLLINITNKLSKIQKKEKHR